MRIDPQVRAPAFNTGRLCDIMQAMVGLTADRANLLIDSHFHYPFKFVPNCCHSGLDRESIGLLFPRLNAHSLKLAPRRSSYPEAKS
jgi:hypothetical protein